MKIFSSEENENENLRLQTPDRLILIHKTRYVWKSKSGMWKFLQKEVFVCICIEIQIQCSSFFRPFLFWCVLVCHVIDITTHIHISIEDWY